MKALSCCTLLLLFTFSSSYAEIYRCKTDNGVVIFTDNALNIPKGCETEDVKELPRGSVTPYRPSPPIKPKTATQRQTSTTKQKKHEPSEKVFSSLKGEAVSLVDQFVSTRSLVYRSSMVRDKQKARRDLKEIRAQKVTMLSEVALSPLNRSQKEEIKKILSSITELQ